MYIKVLPYSLSKRGCKVTSDQNIKCSTGRLGELLHEPDTNYGMFWGVVILRNNGNGYSTI